MEIIENKEKLLKTIKVDGLALEYADDNLKNDKEVVLEAVKNNGKALKYASEGLKNNEEIVLEAIKNYIDALKYASEELKNNKAIILEAVKNDGYNLEYASEKLQNNKKFILKVIKKNGYTLQYVSNDLIEKFKQYPISLLRNKKFTIKIFDKLEKGNFKIKDNNDEIIINIKNGINNIKFKIKEEVFNNTELFKQFKEFIKNKQNKNIKMKNFNINR